MTNRTKAEIIIKKALGEIAVLGGTTLQYIERLDIGKDQRLDIGKDLFNEAILGARENYYQEEVNKQ